MILPTFIARLVCKVRGHRNPAPFFTSNALYFCTCCGVEMFGRTFADLTPMSDAERDAWDGAA